MKPFTQDGDYGEIRLFTNMPPRNADCMFCYTSVGWHRCNDKYIADRRTNTSVDSTLILTVSGNGTLEAYGKKISLSAGDIFILPPNTPHAYYAQNGCLWEFYWLHILDNHATNFINKILEDNDAVFAYKEMPALITKLEKLISFSEKTFDDCSVEQSGIISDILHSLLLYKTKNNYESKRTRDVLEKARHYIEKHYCEDINTKNICTELFISQTHLIRLFKKYLGTTPYQYLEAYRIAKAANLLAHSSMSVSDIAESVGYKSSSNFISSFKKHKKITPQQYRKNGVFAEM